MKEKRLLAVLLAMALVLGLTACGGEKERKMAELAFQTAPYYIQEEMALPLENGELTGCCTDGESIWYLAIPEENAAPVLCRVSLDGGEAEALAEYKAPMEDGEPAVGYVGPVLGGDGKLWVWEQFFVSNTENRQVFHMRQLDPATGGELGVVDITAAMEDMSLLSLNGMVVDEAGTIFLADQKHVTAIDGQGQIMYSLKAKTSGSFFSAGAGGTLALLPDGTLGVLTVQADDERTVKAIDREAQDWAKNEYSIHKSVDEIYPGRGECAFYYITDNTVYGIIPGEKLPLRLLPWSNVQLEEPGSVRCFVLLEEGQAAILTSIHEPGTDWYDDSIQALRLLPSEEAPEGARVRLIYGAIGVDAYITQERIAKFNRGNKDYYIEYRDYSEGMMGWSGNKNSPVYQDALARLYADIAAGRCPDILDESVPLDRLAKKGMLEDLWPWIDSDPEISRDGLMTHVLECLEVDGKLSRVCAGFEIETAVASADVAGGRTGWTMEEMLDAFGGEMPEFYFAREEDINGVFTLFYRFDGRAVLYYLVNMNLSRFADMETGECSFDSEDFKSLLWLAGSGEAVAEIDMNLDDWSVQRNLGLSVVDTAIMSGLEQCRVFPWEGKPVLYARTLSRPRDIVVDDVLFGGREALTDYEQRLVDAGILEYFETEVNGVVYSGFAPIYVGDEYHMDWYKNGRGDVALARAGSEYGGAPVAADCVNGGADGNVYASYPGFPSASGAGSSFTLFQSMAVSASCEAKEAAWAFVRGQLLPNSNATGWYTASGQPFDFAGFAINRETFEEHLRIGAEYWTDPYTGEVFLDANGDPVEFTHAGIGVGCPGDIVLTAYLLIPSEAQMERFWKLYESTEQITGRNDALLDIVMEQADVYFAGDKSLEETVQLIQNRASLYVNENR